MSDTISYRVTNPATGITESRYPTATDTEILDAISRSARAYRGWAQTPFAHRAQVLSLAADLFEQRAADLGRIITREMGKLVDAATGEAAFCGSILRFYADNAADLLADEVLVPRAGGSAVVQKRPIGPLLAVMPWNYPYYQAVRFAAPNLLLGNTILLKHAPSCPESSQAIAQLFIDAGLPSAVFQNIYATNNQCARLIADPRIQGVSLTGSERAGSAIGETAGRNIKKMVLELGGSDALIIRHDADPQAVAQAVVESRLANAGQACNSPKRIIVHDDLFTDVLARIVELAAEITPGDPTDPSTRLAPLASAAAAQHLRAQVLDAVEQGADVHHGIPEAIGGTAQYGPIVLSGITPQMRAYSEELFGPVICLYRVSSDAEAIALTNDSPYGLGATIYTSNLWEAREIADQLDVGMVNINRIPDSDADLPFGGVKKSGFGRELGTLGIEEFANRKLLWEGAIY